MSGLWYFWGSLALLLGGYFVYGAFVEKVFGADFGRLTPVKSRRDGVDYIELPRYKIFLIQLLNIAGLGPVIGPILGALYGPSALLWVVFGCIFGGAVHDYCSAMMSLRYGGASYPEIIGRNLGTGVRRFMEVFAIAFMIMVGAVFVLGPAALLANLTSFGLPFWATLIFAYYFLATIMPIDTIIGRIYPFFSVLLLVMAFGLAGSLMLSGRPVLPNTDFFVNTDPAGLPIWPLLFITIACGALSGFHATIGTGTTPKMIGKERDVLFVGYGAMLVEGFVAIMALIAACVLVPADYFAINAPADKFAALGMSVVDLPTLEKEVAESLMHRPGGSVSLAVGMAHIFGQIPWMAHLMSYWYHFAIMFEAVFILTAVDAGTRVGRFFLQEMIGKVIPKFGDKNWWPGIVVTSFLFTGAWGYLVYTGDISSIWPLFGISNQLLASVTLLIGTTMLLRMNKTKYAWITAAPGIFMTFITFWAGIWLIMYQYIPTQKYLLASLSVLVMVMMGFVIIGTLRRWSVLLKETKIVRDPYGDEVKEIVQE